MGGRVGVRSASRALDLRSAGRCESEDYSTVR